MAIMFFLWDFLKWFLDEKWGGGELRVEDGRGGWNRRLVVLKNGGGGFPLVGRCVCERFVYEREREVLGWGGKVRKAGLVCRECGILL